MVPKSHLRCVPSKKDDQNDVISKKESLKEKVMHIKAPSLFLFYFLSQPFIFVHIPLIFLSTKYTSSSIFSIAYSMIFVRYFIPHCIIFQNTYFTKYGD